MGVSARDYAERSRQKTVVAPGECLACGTPGHLAALGYYCRNLTDGRTIVRIWVRRFRCFSCGRTTSILPAFVQPYRLVQNECIENHFQNITAESTSPWANIVQGYWRRFSAWLPSLREILAGIASRDPPVSAVFEWWETLVRNFGNLEVMTQSLVSRFGITIFGRYRCHSYSV
jgi:hypothetical protein